jgi:SAM-dependent methyltransferase
MAGVAESLGEAGETQVYSSRWCRSSGKRSDDGWGAVLSIGGEALRDDFLVVSQDAEAGAAGYKLNLGCGQRPIDGYINIDVADLPHVDLVISLEDAELPYADNSVDFVLCDHVLEHIDNFIPLVEEIHRVCRAGALVHVTVPYYKYEGAFRDPTHKRFFTERSFDYFTSTCEYSYYSRARFDVVTMRPFHRHKTSGWRPCCVANLFPLRLFGRLFPQAITEIKFVLRAVK